MSKRRVYSFGATRTDGSSALKALLGGKGSNLAEMTRIGIPVPPGFTITTDECIAFETADGELSDELLQDVDAALLLLEEEMGLRFGDAEAPLLVAVRSGARASMPGMMDTVLNVGMNSDTVQGVIARSGNERFAYDSYRRFIQMFGDVVLDVDHFYFEEELYRIKAGAGLKNDNELGPEELLQLIEAYKGVIRKRSSRPFPEDPREQLQMAIKAIFRSWHNKRATHYRELHNIPHDWGTAVNVQAMVFGNMGDTSATGVAFTRDPSTGARERYGEYLPNAQGEDVVAGIRTPQPLSGRDGEMPSLQEVMPEVWKELTKIEDRLEHHYRDMQDIEFTIEQGRLWILQTRNAKRSATAAVRVAVDMVEEGLITRDEALLRVKPSAIQELLHPRLDPDLPREVIARGLAASPGAATGLIALSTEEAVRLTALGQSVILVRLETTPEDIRGMNLAAGILTARGGITSHAAVVARQMGKCCVAGCPEVVPYPLEGRVRIGAFFFNEGEEITLDGSRGEVIRGQVARIPAEMDSAFARLMEWADERRSIEVWTNVDDGAGARTARSFGARGIGLVRTEHMFFAEDRINAMREMILSDTTDSRVAALEKLRPFQQQDFEEILEAMDGLPVTIRLLDPPLHEFLPEREEDFAEIGAALGQGPAQVRALAARLHESNPMLGHRGCRLGITRPEIYRMQVRAIFDATLKLHEAGNDPRPQIMVPLVSSASELRAVRELIEEVRDGMHDPEKVLARVEIGTMLELPRACIAAGELVEVADFLSFGTNDLTQTTFGFSRDDATAFLPHYLERGLLEDDPFVVLDTEGVGFLIKLACRRARRVRPDISIGICGEHGGEPRSVAWLQRGAVNYVSCGPWSVPVARLSAAQAAIGD